MKNTTILVTALALSGCASMVDTMDSMAGLGNINEETSAFDGSKIITLSPDNLYNPEGGFSSVKSRLGAIWSDSNPNFITIILNDEDTSRYVTFSSLSVNINGNIKQYEAGITHFDNDGYNQVLNTVFTSSEAKIAMPLSDFEEMLSSEDCLLKISRSDGYEVASCSKDRIPGGKKTAILGFRKVLTAIDESTK